MKRVGIIVLAMSIAALLPATARASPITLNIQFSLSDFSDAIGTAPAPTGTITGDFTVTFEPGVAIADTATGLTVSSLSFLPASTLQFSITSAGRLAFGGADNTALYIVPGGPTDLGIILNLSDLASPRFMTCAEGAANGFQCGKFAGDAGTLAGAYIVADSPQAAWFARSGSLTVTQVPEPGMLAMALLALGAKVAARRRKRL